jgi:hypothetical protein
MAAAAATHRVAQHHAEFLAAPFMHDLHFAIEVTDVRDATAEELQHGHVHGAGGHHH